MSTLRTFLLLAACLLWPAYGAFGTNDAPSGGETKWIFVSQEEQACSDCIAGVRFAFVFQELASGVVQQISTATAMRAVRTVRIVGAKALILGELSYSGDSVLLYDLASATLIDELYGYQFAVSDSGLAMAYLRFYPRFTPPEFVSDVVLIYDLNKDTEGNRVGSARQAPNPENGGIPIYPEMNAMEQVLAPKLPVNDATQIMAPLVWQGNRLLFMARRGNKTIRVVGVQPPIDQDSFCVRGVELQGRKAGAVSSARIEERKAFLESLTDLFQEPSLYGPGCGDAEDSPKMR